MSGAVVVTTVWNVTGTSGVCQLVACCDLELSRVRRLRGYLSRPFRRLVLSKCGEAFVISAGEEVPFCVCVCQIVALSWSRVVNMRVVFAFRWGHFLQDPRFFYCRFFNV